MSGICSFLQGKLGMDRGVRLENLMVSHFLSVMDRLADPALLQFVKHLQSRAQGEVSSNCCWYTLVLPTLRRLSLSRATNMLTVTVYPG